MAFNECEELSLIIRELGFGTAPSFSKQIEEKKAPPRQEQGDLDEVEEKSE